MDGLLHDPHRRMEDSAFAARRYATNVFATPAVAVVTCCDAHAPSGEVLGQLPRAVLTIGSAAATLGEDVLGCLEYACEVEGASMILVLAHTRCHVIEAACDRIEIGHLTGVLSRIEPAIRAVEGRGTENLSWHTFTERVAMEHVRRQAACIPDRSPVLARLVRDGRLEIVSAMADSDTGALRTRTASPGLLDLLVSA